MIILNKSDILYKMAEYTLITGATGGIGEEFCFQCAARGDNLFLTGRSEKKLAALKEKLKEKYPDAVTESFPCMLNDEADRKKLFDYADGLGAKFSRFINVAGVDTQLAFEKYTQEKLLFQLRVNFEAAVSLTRYVLDRRADGLGILVVSSMSAVCPMPYFALYSATKSALVNFYSALRTEMKEYGVKVTVLMPGGVPTRPDIIEDIKIQGLKGKWSSKPKDFVVRKALKGAEKNKRIVIPGFANKLTYALTRITPVKWAIAFVAKNWKNKEKDAF